MTNFGAASRRTPNSVAGPAYHRYPPPTWPYVMDFTLIIILTLVGFGALAYLLLMPVYRFLKREERASEQWTHEQLRQRQQRQEAPSSNGTGREGNDPTQGTAQSGDETVR